MGASDFRTRAKGTNARDAFNKAVEEAEYNYGHAGYTGSIAEKQTFKEISVPKGMDPETYAEELMDNDDHRVSDKWGPAGCVKIRDGEYLFFGWASS